jgi:hypothetical protein
MSAPERISAAEAARRLGVSPTQVRRLAASGKLRSEHTSRGVPAMASRKRQRIPPTEEWQQLTLLTETPGQRSSEVTCMEQQSFQYPTPTFSTM